VLLDANDEWQLQHRYMPIKGMAELAVPVTDELPAPQLTPKAA
jgi:putative transposase